MRPTPASRRLAAPIGLLVVPLVLAACAAGAGASQHPDEPSASGAPGSSERPTASRNLPQPAPSESTAAVVGEVPDELLDRILADAAERAGVAVDDIEVRRAEEVVWNDGSLGCPEPGMMYTQALVDGYHVVLEADGTELDYRASATGDFRLCESPGPPAGGGDG